ncbi:MAG: beta-galactosidase [Candidatus Hinthialibacter antarcticus]|nr:beta-galactosidase [Candidatus Hinthialibacter antarcticus]
MLRIICAFLLTFAALAHSAESDYDGFGGWTHLKGEATGFFHAEQIDGVWWIIDPVGNVFLSKGVNHIVYGGDYSPVTNTSLYKEAVNELYESPTAWSKVVAERLKAWGFNTIGAWSDQRMNHRLVPYTKILDIGSKAGGNWQRGIFPDVFSKKFATQANHIAAMECKKLRDDMFLLGYYPDNELRWGPDWRNKNALLIDFLAMEPSRDGGEQALLFLKKRYRTIEELNQAWKIQVKTWDEISKAKLPESEARKKDEAEFLRKVADQYFRVCYEAVKKADPNHMLLGCRFAGYAPEPVLAAAGTYSDVISYNSYNRLPPVEALNRVHEITTKPIMLTEFSFKAMDSGLPNTKGAGKPVATQKDRAALFTQYVNALMKLPYAVGYHWFKYADQPPEGRFDGENSNYGLVSLKDAPWETLVNEMTKTNRSVELVHQKPEASL